MKKTCTVILSFFIGMLFVSGQGSLSQRASIAVPYNNAISSFKTSTCIDTIRYPDSKLTNLVELDSLSFNGISAYSQAYHFSGSGIIHGFNAYILLDFDNTAGNTNPIRLIASVHQLFNINTNYPNAPDLLIHTDTVDVFDVSFRDQPLMFSSPVAVTDSFVLVLELDTTALPPTLPYYGYNGYADGLGESLSWANYLGIWYNCYYDWGGAWDSDMLLSPIFEETFTTAYTVDTDTICLGESVKFTNTTLASIDTMFYTASNSYSLDLDNMNIVTPFDTNYTHTYSTEFLYNTQVMATRYGYTANCVDSAQEVVLVNDTAIADFSFVHLGGGNYQFTSTSTAANTYSWDFGDTSPLDINQNPTHTYVSSNNFTVCLTVTDSNGCNVDSVCKVVSFVLDVDDFDAADYVKIYPIPATKYFNITVPNNYYGGEIVITDVVGQELKSVEVEHQDKVKVSTEEMESGIYFVSIDFKGERVFTKRIVVNK
ncbi:MAG: hypothetical protein COB15_08535 [Flavobacteriales bacterium]|nr:MAG: hypothetical protein COB15_08535 [Flavobacteriales bacterium]